MKNQPQRVPILPVRPVFLPDVLNVLPVKVHGRRVPVERVRGVGVGEELREEALEDVGEVVERRPRLVDHVQAHRAGDLVDVGVVHLKAFTCVSSSVEKA